MSSVGAYLRQLRETRGVSLEDIARVALTLLRQSGREAPEDRRAARGATPPVAVPGAPPMTPPSATSPAPSMPAPPPAPPVAPGAPPRQSGYRLVARTIEPTWIR